MFNIVNGRGDEVGAELAAHPDVAKISFTGSTRRGQGDPAGGRGDLEARDARARRQGAAIILDDADLEQVIPAVVDVGFMNSGQACIAGTRVLVPESRLERFVARLKTAIEVR